MKTLFDITVFTTKLDGETIALWFGGTIFTIIFIGMIIIISSMIFKKYSKSKYGICCKCGNDLIIDKEIGEKACPQGHVDFLLYSNMKKYK